MPRANRYFLAGYVWHITHRCHKREFLLKFAVTRQRYLHWLYQARKRFAVEIHCCLTIRSIKRMA